MPPLLVFVFDDLAQKLSLFSDACEYVKIGPDKIFGRCQVQGLRDAYIDRTSGQIVIKLATDPHPRHTETWRGSCEKAKPKNTKF